METVISDPCYATKKFVTLSTTAWDGLLDRFAKHGIRMLIDLHAMPCGSSDASYNGVYVFETSDSLRGKSPSV